MAPQASLPTPTRARAGNLFQEEAEVLTDGNGAAEGDQITVGNLGVGQNGPVTHRRHGSGDEDRGNPGFGCIADVLTGNISDGTEDECEHIVVHNISSYYLFLF